MLNKALSLALIAGGLTVLSAAPAQAATACPVGRWKVTDFRAKITGEPQVTIKGFAGTRLRIEKNGRLTFSFAAAKPADVVQTGNGETARGTLAYRGTLRLKATLKGDKKGTLNTKPSSASGNATAKTKIFASPPITFPAENLAKNVKSGDHYHLNGGTFTCSGKSLKISYRHTGSGEIDTGAWTFRRA